MAAKKPLQVIVKDTEKPLPVTLEAPPKQPGDVVSKGEGKTLSPQTTEQEDLTKLGQRRVNIMWELTQGLIAISISWAVIYCQINKIDSQILNNAFFLIVSMYYVRTNHQLIGGIGPKQGTR